MKLTPATAVTAALLLAVTIAPALASNARADRNMAAANRRRVQQWVFNMQMARSHRAIIAEQQAARLDPRNAMNQRTPTGRILLFQQRRQQAVQQFIQQHRRR